MALNESKKAQAGNITSLIVGVGVAVLVLIFVGALGGQTYNLVEDDINEIANNAVTNESFTGNNVTAAQLANDYVQSGTLTITNSTGGAIALANFTIGYDAGTILVLGATYNGTSMLASYTHGNLALRTSVTDGITSSFEALERTGDYLPIIVLAIVIFFVLTLVLGFSSPAMGGKNMGGAL